MNSFIITWKEDVWDLKNIELMLAEYKANGFVERDWRISAYRLAKVGDRAYLLKQGGEPRGIFGVGTLVDAPSLRHDTTVDGPERMRALIRFEILSHPVADPFLIDLTSLQGILEKWQIEARSSGQAALAPDVADWFEGRFKDRMSDPSGATPPTPVTHLSPSPTTGPLPTAWSRIVMRQVGEASSTYALRFGTRTLWKIGHTEDLHRRLIEVNRHIPHEILSEKWTIAMREDRKSSLEAYLMEQTVLELLASKRTYGERVLCDKLELEDAWVQARIKLAASNVPKE